MKRKFIVTTLLALMLVLSLSLIACDGGGGEKTLPTQKQWADVGISGTFDVEIKGELSQSVVSENNEISMKWEGSDEASLDNTIDWLKEQGYDSYGGANAQKTTEEGGKIISYTAEKSVGGAITMSADGNVAAISLSAAPVSESVANKNMIAETFYITEDFSIMGVNFKAGELYLDICEKETNIEESVLDAWPATQIQNVIGENVPAYAGAENGFQFTNASMSYMKTVQINVFGAGDGDATAYGTLLAQNGYVLNDDQIYEKTLSNGSILQIMAFASQTYHPENFQIVDVVCVTIMLEKNSGTYTSWSALNLSEFSGANIPSFSGGTSFDIDDAMSESIDLTEYEQIIASLEAFESYLDEEQRAQLEYARQYIALASQIKSSVVTVYGTNEQEADAYEAALQNAGFVDGIKNTTTHQYQIDVSEDEGKAIISILKMPIELAEDIDEEGGGGGSSVLEGNETIDWDDLPTNVKFTFVDSANNNYTLTKKGNDYLIKYIDSYIFLKESNNGWIMYSYSSGSWIEGDTIEELDYVATMNSVSYVLFDNDLSGYEKGSREQVAGVTCDVYTYGYDSYGMSMNYVKKVNADGIVFYSGTEYSMSGQTQTMTSQISLWDTNVSSFEITPPQ